MSKNRNTYRSYVIKSFIHKINIFNRIKNKKTVNDHERSPYSNAHDAPVHIAFVVDGIVEDIIHCDERMGYLLMSYPVIVQLENVNSAKINDIYNEQTNTFQSLDDV